MSIAGSLLTGCQTLGESGGDSAVVFARAEPAERSYHVQPADGGRPPSALNVRGAGNLRTAPRAGIAAATVSTGPTGSAELRLLPLGSSAGERVLASEWAWDFALRAEGDAIAWIAGRERRELFVARAPEWKPVAVATPVGAEPSEPRWLSPDRLLVVLRRTDYSELAEIATGSGAVQVVYHAMGRAALADACPVAGTADVVVVESPEGDRPARVLRIALEGGQPEVLATGYFAGGTLAVSPDGRYIGAVWNEAAAPVLRREAAWRWIGPAWAGAPESVPGVTALVWSPDGAQMVLARQREGRRWIEVYSASAANRPRRLGFEDAECLAPQWWRMSR